MKRASLFTCLLLTLTGSLSAAASERTSQQCAEAAFEITGEARYEVTEFRTPFYGYRWHVVTLKSLETGSEVTCRSRRGRITELTMVTPEASEAEATQVVALR